MTITGTKQWYQVTRITCPKCMRWFLMEPIQGAGDTVACPYSKCGMVVRLEKKDAE